MIEAFKQLIKEIFCSHEWDKTHGYYEYPVAGAKCVKCNKVG